MTPTEAPETQSPEEQVDPQFPYGQRLENLPEQLVNLIKGTIEEFQKQDTYLRRREVMRDRKARFYERGYQHITWTGAGNNGGFALVTPGMQIAGSAAQAPQYVDDYDIFWPYERIVLSILTQNIPGVDFQPISDKSEDVEAADQAEIYSEYFDRHNDVKGIQRESLRMMMLGGRSISWTREEARGAMGPDGPRKQIETTTIFGTLESRVPIMTKCQEDALFCILYDDPNVKQAKYDYDWIKEKIQGNQAGLGENQYERLARLGALQGSRQTMATGESYSYLTTRLRCWLRLAAFSGKEYDAAFEEDPTVSCRDKLTELYPEGGCFTFVGSTYAESYPEDMDDHLDISFPIEGDGMFRKAPMDSMVVIQDAFNDACNVARLIFDVGWPSRWFAGDQTEFDALRGQVASPFALRLKKLVGERKAEDFFFQEPLPELPETFVQWVEFIQGALPQFMTATPPALWGAQMEDQKTAHGYAQAQQSAMGQLGMLWSVLQHQFARIRYQSALCAASNPDHENEIVIPGQVVTLSKIRKDAFGCYPDEDSSFPETTAAKRAAFDNVMEKLVAAQSPIATEILNDPENVSQYLRDSGLAELRIPQSEANDAQQFEIEELLKAEPIVSPAALGEAQMQHAVLGVQAQANAGPEPPPFDQSIVAPDQPSVLINDYDYHPYHAAKCQEWLNGPECRRQQAEGNKAGVQNVVLHWKAHVAAMVAAMPPPMPTVPAPHAPLPGAPAPVPPPAPSLTMM